MAIEITITQKSSSKKVLPLEVIIGSKLRYGYFDGVRLEEEMLGKSEFIAYNPNHIGRGFSVKWKEGETYQVYLRLTIPSHDKEIDDFYDTVTRIATYWENCEIRQNKRVLAIDDFVFQRSNTKANSLQTLSDLCNKTKISKDGNVDLTSPYEAEISLHCAKWPIILGKKEKVMLANSVDSTRFKEFLHEKQAIDAYYGKAFFSQHKYTKELNAKYVIDEGKVSIFPLKPEVPWWMINKQTGKPVKVAKWEIGLFSTTKDDLLGVIPYADFIARFKNFKNTEYYDHNHVLTKGVSLSEMEELLGAGSLIVQ